MRKPVQFNASPEKPSSSQPEQLPMVPEDELLIANELLESQDRH